MKFGVMGQYHDQPAGGAGNTAEPLNVVQAPDTTLFQELGTVSTEAGFIGNVARYFSRRADSLNIAVREGFKYLTTFTYDPMETLHPGQMVSFVQNLDYMELEDLKVAQPVGFKDKLLPYTASLLDRAKVMDQVLEQVIRPATARFGHYLTTPVDRAERRGFQYGVQIGQSIDELVKADAQFFASSRSSTASFGKLFDSMSDFVGSERNMLEVNTVLKGGVTSDVKNAVNALSLTATALIDRIGKESDIKTSSEFAKMMAEELTEVAKWVEWYAVQMTRIIETNNVLYAIEVELLKH